MNILKNKKNYILSFLLLIVIILITCIIYVVINNKNFKDNSDDNFKKLLYNEAVIDNMSIAIKEIKYDGEFSDISLKLVNNTENVINFDAIKLIFKDKDYNIICELISPSVEMLDGKESAVVETSIDIDLSTAISVDYEVLVGDSYE